MVTVSQPSFLQMTDGSVALFVTRDMSIPRLRGLWPSPEGFTNTLPSDPSAARLLTTCTFLDSNVFHHLQGQELLRCRPGCDPQTRPRADRPRVCTVNGHHSCKYNLPRRLCIHATTQLGSTFMVYFPKDARDKLTCHIKSPHRPSFQDPSNKPEPIPWLAPSGLALRDL